MKYLIIMIALFAGALAVAVKLALASARRARELKTAMESARDELRRMNEYRKQREEAQQNANDKKETLRTGDADTDFTNSLDVLHNAGKNRGR